MLFLCIQITDRFNFRPFNFNEIWSQKALATIPQQRVIGGQPTLEYFPLDGDGITLDSPRRVHLFIMGMNDMSISLAVNAAHILHFPNFRDGDFSTASTITFIAPNADRIGGQMRRQYSHLFDLARWRQIEGKDSMLPDMGWNDPMKDPNGPYRHLGDKNFMDIQWEFIIGGMLDNEVHSYLEKCTFDENEITTIALCDEDSELNTKLCLALSDSVHRDANMILVRQKENPITANLVSLFNPQKVIFGGGVFGPAIEFIDRIRGEARKWGQPISMRDVKFCASAVGGDAALLGAAYLGILETGRK